MLNKVQQLGDSVTVEQIIQLRNTLGDDLYNLLDHSFESETEEEAELRVGLFVSAAKKSIFKIVKARKFLDNEQRTIISDLLGV